MGGSPPVQLRPFMGACFASAKIALLWSTRLALSNGVLALLVAFLPESWTWVAWCVGLASLLLVLGQQYCDHAFRREYDEAERIRRLLLISDGLGDPVSAAEMAKHRLEFDDLQPDGSAYYTSDLPLGANRLLMLTWESAFWTGHLQQLLARRFWRLAALATVIFLMAAFVVLAVTNAAVVPKAVVAAFSLLAGLNLWGKWWSCRSTAEACVRISHECDTALSSCEQRGDQWPSAMHTLADYTAIMASSYPPPDALYEANRALLNREWGGIASEVQAHRVAEGTRTDVGIATTRMLENNAHGFDG